MRRSDRVFGGLILLLAALSATGVYLPQGGFAPAGAEELPAPRWVVATAAALGSVVVYGTLGWIGLRLVRRLHWPEPLDPAVSGRLRWGVPVLTGCATGLSFILIEQVAVRLHPLGPLPHPPFPTSVVASLAAGIGEETIFRLFFVTLWVWLVSERLLGGRRRRAVFWSVAVLSGVAFAASHLPSVLLLYGAEGPADLPLALLGELLVLNGLLSLVAAWHLREHGFLAAAGAHFWTDVVWHVIHGPI